MPIHLRAEPGQYAEAVLLPGDPLRAKYISETYLEKPIQRNAERGLLGYTGTYKGKSVSVQGTGMGCPGATIVFEELVQLGCTKLIRVGTCGGLQASHALGDLIVALSAVPADSTATHLVRGEPHCPTASWSLVHEAVHLAKHRDQKLHVGPIVSSDLFYNPDDGQYERWASRGLLAVEMEAAALFTVAAIRGVASACLLTVSDIVVEGVFTRISDEELRAAVDRMTTLALDVAVAGDRLLPSGEPPAVAMSRKAVFLVNPASGNGTTGRRWPELLARARALGLGGEPILSERPGQLIELAAAAAAEGGLLVVVGGDGTLNEVVNGAAGSDAEIAVIPAGTGRDFGRTYGIPTRFDDAVRVAVDGTTRTIDLGRAEFALPGGGKGLRLFANAGSVGMSGAVAHRANSMSKRLGGRVTFYAALVREFLSWTNTEMTVAFERGERRGRMHDVVVANGRFLGGGMKLAPDARPDDGLFDVVVVGDVSKLDFATTSPKLYRGGHIGHPRIEVVQSAWVTVEADDPMLVELDGEQEGTTPVRFEVVPDALRIRVPR